jgi:hypothetical protein
MSILWYQNPTILLNNLNQIFPSKNLSKVEKINSLARLSIYSFIFIIVSKQDTKYLSISIIILLISLFLDATEKFKSVDEDFKEVECQKPTKNNPFMNFTFGDLLVNKNRNSACKYEDVKKDIRKQFRSHVHTDISDIWGKYISDRNFYTMPNTDIVNDQTGFALWLFGNSGECKTTGNNCLKQRDPIYHRGRLTDINDMFN